MLILALLFVRVLLFIAVGPRSTSAFPNAKCHAPLGAAIDIKAPVYKQEWSPRTRRMERRIQHGRVPWQGAEAYLKGKWRSLATEPHTSGWAVYVLPGTPLYQLDRVHERRVHLDPAHAAELLGLEPNRM